MQKTIAAALVFTVMSGAAFAQTYNTPVYEFKVVDTNSDGKISLTEAQAKAPDVTVGDWMRADDDGDGLLNGDEFAIAMRAYQRSHQ